MIYLTRRRALRPCFVKFPNTEKRFVNTTRKGVFLMNFEVFGNVKRPNTVFNARGAGVLPNMGCIGMCGPKGYGFQPFWS